MPLLLGILLPFIGTVLGSAMVFLIKGEINIKICNSRNKDACISVDGQQSFKLECDDKIIIKKLEKKITLISSTQEKFYNALRSKLNWSGVPHA